MMDLKDKKVLIFAGPDFEDRELFYPLYRFREEGATVKVAGLPNESVHTGKYGIPVTVDGDYGFFVNEHWDCIVVAGGWAPDKVRMNHCALEIVRKTLEAGGVASAICHGGWVLASADVIRNRTLTSYKAIKDDMTNAGANWVDEEVVVDNSSKGTVVTSRTPDDLPAFCKTLVGLMAKTPAVV